MFRAQLPIELLGMLHAEVAMAMPTADHRRKPLEVLVIEDEPDLQELLAEHLRARGLRVATASDGAAAVAVLQRNPGLYSMVVTDLQLPGADGFAVLNAARAANPSVYVVIITGYASLDAAIQAVRLGAYDFLTKPFSLGQIDALLRRVEDRLALEEENRALMRRIDTRSAETAHGAHDRLAQIEARLASIESAIRDLTLELSRRRP
jgi:DNA-binding NtrC family response regulator